MKQVLFILISLSICSFGTAQIKATSVQSPLNFTSQECPQVIFIIGNGMSRMPSMALKNINEARVEMSDFSKSGYTLQKFTITILHNESHTFETITNDGNTFTEKTKILLSTVKPNDVIMAFGISAVDQSGKIINIPERNFGLY